ncbi:hypothetical protein KP509_20G049400 [Ceratopteris richardii]|uniref:TraB domain-containing protein n=1 Tax=Ceratopteris richardii TaxID=49495 RepID=A0A8T2SII7_CERRI|nr:hypothetical protein KP509_20G049400 [Ceratopteris richardii]
MDGDVSLQPTSEPTCPSPTSNCVATDDLPALKHVHNISSRCSEPAVSDERSIPAECAANSNPVNISERHQHLSHSAERTPNPALPLPCSPSTVLESPTMMELLNNNPSQSSSLHVSSSHLIENDSAVQEDSAMTHRFSSPSEGNLSSEASSNTSGQPENEGLAEEDSHYQEQELPDDTKKEMFKEICKGSFILSRHSEALGIDSSVYLIGTAHVSEESCREVKAAIRLIKPQVVFLELCHKRTSVLQTTPFVVPTLSDMISTWKQRKSNMLGIVYGWFLAKVADKLDISPGSEFRAAYEEALDCGAKVVLGDRDIQVTLRRTWGKMSMWHKTKFILVLIYQSLFLPQAEQLNELIEKLKDADILTVAFEELSKFSPTLLETLINERDM